MVVKNRLESSATIMNSAKLDILMISFINNMNKRGPKMLKTIFSTGSYAAFPKNGLLKSTVW